jgi:TRAP-type C4-dicarboxylate transport system substrate-binding protein
MKVAKLLLIAVLVVSFLFSLPGCKKPANGTGSDVIVISYANFPPASTFPCVQMERFKEQIEKNTAGKVRIETYPDGTLLGAKDMFDGVVSGQADIGCLCMAYQPGRFLVTNAVSLPLQIPNAKVGSRVLYDLYNKYKPDAFAKVKVLTMFSTAPSNIMSKKPVRTLDDIKSLNIRASGGAAQILQAWNANPVGMPMSEAPQALQRGVVQGLFSSLEVMKDFNYAELCKYITRTETVIYPFAVVMNLDKWNALPQDVKDIFENLALDQSNWTGSYMDQHVEDAVKWSIAEKSVEVIQLSPEQLEKWNQPLKPMIAEWIKKADSQNIPAQTIVDDIKDLIKKHQAQ